MAVKVINIKVCSLLKQRDGLTGKCHAIGYYSYTNPYLQPMETVLTWN